MSAHAAAGVEKQATSMFQVLRGPRRDREYRLTQVGRKATNRYLSTFEAV